MLVHWASTERRYGFNGQNRTGSWTVRFAHMGHDDGVFPTLLDPIDGLAGGHEASIVRVTHCVDDVVARAETLVVHRAAGGEVFVVLVQHGLRREPAFAPVALHAVVVDDRDGKPSLGIDREGIDKVAKVWVARDANHCFRYTVDLISGLL
ncbi:hypothetical protein MMC07_005992 [Pseudocyphellaria aurata]|nr:hypothetical protein [Pseudocyphellaria aurata]